ncbi:expansin-A13-like [Populus alba x Populus x berolinensis]|nr:expansin-A13-like [Populus alba x Populus x berolinensis]
MTTVGLSESMFERGQICGACFQLQCVDDLRWFTNFCAPNYGFTSDGGGKCNPPNNHFVLPNEAFEKIAIWKAANMPIQYRRIKCRRDGGIRFCYLWVRYFPISVLSSNVLQELEIFNVQEQGGLIWAVIGARTGHVNANINRIKLSHYEVTSSERMTVLSYNVAPKDWRIGQAFEGKQF